jgi:hypothetical protein
MSAPLMPSPLDQVGRRRFSFYPTIANADPNEWLVGSATWSDLRAVNAITGREIWIPRQFIAAVFEDDDLFLIVRLTKELEYRAGTVGPRVRRVIEMPAPERDLRFRISSRQPSFHGESGVVEISLDHRVPSRTLKWGVAIAIGALVAALLSAGALHRDRGQELPPPLTEPLP